LFAKYYIYILLVVEPLFDLFVLGH